MDRIKQALDKARAERAAAGYGTGELVVESNNDVASTPALDSGEIKYSKTRVVAPNAAALTKNHVIFNEFDQSGLAAYKMLRTQVLQRMTAKGWNAFAITSPGANEGKSLTAINLAISLARELHHSVLLVDLDLRNPSIHRYFGLSVDVGIDDYLLNSAPLENILINPGIERLVLLPARRSIGNSSELLASPPVGRLVQELKSRYPARMVVFDLPPVLEADDALSFSPFVDAFLLVVRDGMTTHAALEHSLDILKGTTLLGTVLNDSPEKISAYY